MKTLRSKASAVADYYSKGLRWLAIASGVIILVLMAYINADVAGRALANQPMPAGVAITRTLMVFIVFMGLAHTYARGGHVSLEFLFERLNTRGQAILKIFGALLGLFFLCLMTWIGWLWAYTGWERNVLFEGAHAVPVYPARFILTIGAFLFVIQLIINLIRAIGQFFSKGQIEEQQ